MARAKRHYIPGYVWHITHRCHKKEFLLKFPIRERSAFVRLLFFLEISGIEGITLLLGYSSGNHRHHRWSKRQVECGRLLTMIYNAGD